MYTLRKVIQIRKTRNIVLSVFNIYLLRHGELVQSGILCGHTDIALSNKGEQQLVDATKILPKISSCYSSPLSRCRKFAEQYCQQSGLSLTVLTELAEMNFGDWDGQCYQKLWQPNEPKDISSLADNAPNLGDFWQNPWQCQPPNGETMTSFTQRVDNFWHELLTQLEQTFQNKNHKDQQCRQKNTLVVSHGGVIRYILAKVLGLPIPGVNHMANIDVPYGALIHLQITIDDSGKSWPKLML